MKIDNKGLSLVELIVSVAILGIVTVTSLGFLVSGSRSYSSVSGSIGLQVKSQLAMNNVQEHLIDCNTAVCFDDFADSLYIIDSRTVTDPVTGSESLAYTVHIFKYDDAAQALYYGENPAVLQYTGEYVFTDSAPDLLADGVSGFSVSVSGSGGVTDATVSISFFVRSKTFTGVQTVALRNRPLPATVNALPP